ncbi:oxygenase MpaB family protein [Flammeovirgaceae bacterium SG7u.111]|nr:oxygenase MpaB family protein [Flammeovirgaceae bacterium SG7u.132]WPO34427.1 oxygenase MpaB family protein [Flammeovirgaceae bacterium SG7u.111]
MKYTSEFLQPYRTKGDPLADELISQIYSEVQAGATLRGFIASVSRNNEPLPNEFPSFISDFFENTKELPSWADPVKMKKGAGVFATNAQEIMSLLGYYSLPYCYAAANGAKVLWLSERTKSDTFQRLLETAQFIFDVLDKNAFEPDGFGIRSIQKVRLLHAAIRFHVLQKPDWKSKEWGIPVNQEDMAGTNLAFSLIILRGLRKMGKGVSAEDAEAYLHLWNVIGSMMGIEEELIPKNAKQFFWLEKGITDRNFAPSAEGTGLTKALLNNFGKLPISFPKGYHVSFMRFLMGDDLANLLNIPPSNWTMTLVKQQKNITALFQFVQADYNKRNSSSLTNTRSTIERYKVSRAYKLPNGLGKKA